MFDPEEPREARFDAAACEGYFAALQQSGGVSVCGLCLYACPYGKRKEVALPGTKRR